MPVASALGLYVPAATQISVTPQRLSKPACKVVKALTHDDPSPVPVALALTKTLVSGVKAGHVVPVVTPPVAMKLDVVPVKAKLVNVPVLLLPLASVRLVIAVLLALAAP